MIKFKIEEKEYKIPDYVSIDNYSKIFKIKDLFSEEYFAAKLVSIVSGADIEDLLETDYQELNYLATYVLDKLPKDKPKFIDRFELNGVHYGFFPNWQDLTYAEFVDMDTISTKKEDELLNLLHILCAIMYRPIITERSEHDFDIEKYDVSKMKVRAELFKKQLDVKYVLGAQFFFINYARKFSNYTQASSIQKLSIGMKMKLIWKMRKLIWRIIFRKPLDGSLSQTELLEMILRNTTTSTKGVLTKY